MLILSSILLFFILWIIKYWLYCFSVYWVIVGDVIMGYLGINYGYERMTPLDRCMIAFEGRDDETIYTARLDGKPDLLKLRDRLKQHVMQFHRLKCRPF